MSTAVAVPTASEAHEAFERWKRSYEKSSLYDVATALDEIDDLAVKVSSKGVIVIQDTSMLIDRSILDDKIKAVRREVASISRTFSKDRSPTLAAATKLLDAIEELSDVSDLSANLGEEAIVVMSRDELHKRVCVMDLVQLEELVESATERASEIKGMAAMKVVLDDKRLQGLLDRVAAALPSEDWRTSDVKPEDGEKTALMEHHWGTLDVGGNEDTVMGRLFEELNAGLACRAAAQLIDRAWAPMQW